MFRVYTRNSSIFDRKATIAFYKGDRNLKCIYEMKVTILKLRIQFKYNYTISFITHTIWRDDIVKPSYQTH